MSDRTPPVGSDAGAARDFDKNDKDFGVKPGDRRAAEYASEQIRRQDPGKGVEHARGEGTRTSGVGGNDSGRGSSSGGDVDADDASVIGLGEPGHATSPADNPKGPKIASTPTLPAGAALPGDGTGSNVNHDGNSGAGNVNNPDRDDNAFAGEVTPEEATGQG